MRIKLLILSMTAFGLIISCSKSETHEMSEGNLSEIQFSASSFVQLQTKADPSTIDFPTDRDFAVYGWKTDGDLGTALGNVVLNNEKAEYSTDRFVTTDGKAYWDMANGSAKRFHFAAYAPHLANSPMTCEINGSSKFVLKFTGYQSSDIGIDLLYSDIERNQYRAKPAGSELPPPVTLTFHHSMSRLIFNFVTTDASNVSVELVSANLIDFCDKGDFSYTEDATASWNNVTKSGGTVKSAIDATTKEAFVIPQAVGDNTAIEFTYKLVFPENVTSGPFQAPLLKLKSDAEGTPVGNWEMNMQTTYNFTINPYKGEVTFGTEMSDWKTASGKIDAN